MNKTKLLILTVLVFTGYGVYAQPGTQPGTASPVPLSFPSEVEVLLVPTNQVQVLTFTGTNATDRAVNILGYGASCGCTTVEAKGMLIPAHGKMEYRVKIARSKATTEYAIIVDANTNIYVVTFRVVPALANAPIPNTRKP